MFLEQWIQIQAAVLQQLGHLHPGFEHFAAVNSLNCGAFENYIIYEVKRNWIRRNSEQRRASALPQHLKSLMNRRSFPTAHLRPRRRWPRAAAPPRCSAWDPGPHLRPFVWLVRGDAD